MERGGSSNLEYTTFTPCRERTKARKGVKKSIDCCRWIFVGLIKNYLTFFSFLFKDLQKQRPKMSCNTPSAADAISI